VEGIRGSERERGWQRGRHWVGRWALGVVARLAFAGLAVALGFGSAATDLRAQCNAAKPTGATLVKQGSGTFVAAGPGKQSFSQFPLSLANYSSGGLLTIQITLGSGASAASFDLFAGNAAFASGSTTAQPLSSQTNVAPGGCATLTYKFSQAGSYILAVTGGSSSAANSTNTFQYSAYVQPTLTGAAPSQPSTPQTSPPSTQPAQPPTQPVTPPTNTQQTPPVATTPPYRPPTTRPTPATNSQQSQSGAQSGGQPGTQSGAQGAQTGNAQPTQTANTQAYRPPTTQPPLTPGTTSLTKAGPTGTANPPGAQPPAKTNQPTNTATTTAQTSSTNQVVLSVSIVDSPPVPDLGGNSVLWGLLTRGSLTAILPNLQICARPQGSDLSQRVCTTVCKPGHQCMDQPLFGVVPAGPLTVNVRNVDQKGPDGTMPNGVTMGNWDIQNPANCTDANPCGEDTNPLVYGKDASGNPLQVKIAFNIGANCAQPNATPGSPVTLEGPNLGPTRGVDTFTPTPGATQVYPSSVVDVQTVMMGTQGARPKCDEGTQGHEGCLIEIPQCALYGKLKESCNGITLHVGASVPNVHFVQFFYKVLKGTNNQPIPYRVRYGLPGCMIDIRHPQSCYDMFEGNWIPDAAAAPNPYYSVTDTVVDCHGWTMFDSPTFDDSLKDVTAWVFHGKDFVISNGSVVATVDWTLNHATNTGKDYSGPYTVNITPANPPFTVLPSPILGVATKYQLNSPVGPNAAP